VVLLNYNYPKQEFNFFSTRARPKKEAPTRARLVDILEFYLGQESGAAAVHVYIELLKDINKVDAHSRRYRQVVWVNISVRGCILFPAQRHE
jgi:hypothetical protein